MIVKTNGDILTEDQKQQFYDLFGDITDGIFIESIMDCWPTFEQKKVEVNQERGIYGQGIREVMVCPYVFYSISVNSDGTVSLCFLDWKRDLVLGDVKTERNRYLAGRSAACVSGAFLAGRAEIPSGLRLLWAALSGTAG